MRSIGRLIVLLMLFWLIGFVAFLVFMPKPARKIKTQAIVVLTGAQGRIERGLSLMQNGAAQRMLISGVGQSVRPRDVAAEYQVKLSLIKCCVDIGHQATDTIGNATEVANWVRAHNYTQIRLVTNDWHMRRARLELAYRLPASVVVIEDGVKGQPGMETLFTEYNKYLWRSIRLHMRS